MACDLQIGDCEISRSARGGGLVRGEAGSGSLGVARGGSGWLGVAGGSWESRE
jgi:hypothetical protein